MAKIKTLIEQTQAQLNKNLVDSERLQNELKLAELQIAETATILNQTDKKLSQTRIELSNLQAQKSNIELDIKQQQNALASQLKSAYMAGDYDFAKMVFNQDQAGKFERVLTYYQYLNKARQKQINRFRSLIKTLEDVQQKLDTQESELAILIEQQSSQSKKLSSQQQKRFAAYTALEKQIRSDQARVSQLQQQENALVAAIEAAELAAKAAREKATAQDIELNGLSTAKGELGKPANGRMQALFGKRRQGQVRWKGVIFDARAGSTVRAVADGIVLYADWLKGFGLVTIVDHGQGYMTVYGRNQALLRNVGDVVLQGQSLSLAGTSGGQSKSGLYFEIRHKGKALNPSQWLQN
ncbi:murein hydrolase activator EnvC family protein [Glaciecola petra]|uniref:Peptidoglycan DD-metalloendopeptidase family protein n=1 Tax=Glaciecola petra TaxID=3075602 RepID=A0ABU2ZV86_9ALTE|nr:peptidoglycan DD-metalloendopeptidase family protein [Aestuariibacter sp. P117]MDT0595504.1 peptidoglycan DD-metalloendopeptidase family protein [Aestuariibacter sp. P117]